MNTETQNNKCIEVCNDILKGELSAVETYQKAIEKFGDHPAAARLAEIKGIHEVHVGKMKSNIVTMGGTPSTESGAWGTFANTVQSTANLFGKESAVESLIQGEQHGQRQYQEALENEEVMVSCKELFSHELLPNITSNISTLESLEDSV